MVLKIQRLKIDLAVAEWSGQAAARLSLYPLANLGKMICMHNFDNDCAMFIHLICPFRAMFFIFVFWVVCRFFLVGHIKKIVTRRLKAFITLARWLRLGLGNGRVESP
jgi:hypothetical protein